MRFTGRTAAITGGTSGIGLATALRLASEGAAVVLAGRHPARGAAAVASVEALGGVVRYVCCDVSSEAEVRVLYDRAVREFGGVDLALHCAGTEGVLAAVEDYPPRAAEEVLATNLTGVFLCTRAALPLLRARGGVLINTASFQGTAATSPDNALYAASKAAVAAFTASVAAALADDPVRIYALCPWVTDSPMVDRIAVGSAEAKARLASQNPGGRIVPVEDVAGVVADLWAGALDVPSGAAVLVERGGAVSCVDSMAPALP